MKFAVKALSGGGSRTGLLQIGSSLKTPLETPAILLSTRKGLPFFLTPDLLSSFPSPHSRLLHVCPLHFFEGLSLQTISKLGGLHKLLDLAEYEYVSVLRDSIVCVPDPSGVNKFGASFSTPIGRFTVKAVEYIDMISSMKPNIWASLADEVPANVSAKRNKISVDRTIRWLDECITLSSGDGAVFGSIVGGDSIEERKRCAEEVASRNVSGCRLLDWRIWAWGEHRRLLDSLECCHKLLARGKATSGVWAWNTRGDLARHSCWC